LAREGADLFLVDLDREGLFNVAAEARELGVDEMKRAWGRLHILVNNAGILYYDRTDRMS